MECGVIPILSVLLLCSDRGFLCLHFLHGVDQVDGFCCKLRNIDQLSFVHKVVLAQFTDRPSKYTVSDRYIASRVGLPTTFHSLTSCLHCFVAVMYKPARGGLCMEPLGLNNPVTKAMMH